MNEKTKPNMVFKPKTFVEDAPPLEAVVEETPRVIIYDPAKALEEANKAKPKPVISAQTRVEMEAGAATLRRLQGME